MSVSFLIVASVARHLYHSKIIIHYYKVLIYHNKVFSGKYLTWVRGRMVIYPWILRFGVVRSNGPVKRTPVIFMTIMNIMLALHVVLFG